MVAGSIPAAEIFFYDIFVAAVMLITVLLESIEPKRIPVRSIIIRKVKNYPIALFLSVLL